MRASGLRPRSDSSFCPAAQVRDAVITMLDDWIGERGRVPLERLAPAVHDVIVAPKMSPEGRIAAISWLGSALAAEQVRPCTARSGRYHCDFITEDTNLHQQD